MERNYGTKVRRNFQEERRNCSEEKVTDTDSLKSAG